ncbi:unknown protein [Desulfotalea psychrophila LSv54]|uniref:Uncharacterized protein n=1 Tax=Desulfotalea psychrophila (strain LSv54 / DSM 12343) TaxID=177439 RepID=Q6ARW6_DESPS|nr:unknown protein [Desulfotalea psychrophila LSv54]
MVTGGDGFFHITQLSEKIKFSNSKSSFSHKYIHVIKSVTIRHHMGSILTTTHIESTK